MSNTPAVTSPLTQLALAPNPGPMTLDGTNSYLLGTGRGRIVVDPGPLDEGHLAALTVSPVELILLTHHHIDHSEAAPELASRTGASVRAASPGLCIGAPPLEDGEELVAAGVRVRVVATPGHTADSVSFHLPEDGKYGSVITGDSILGRGTSAILFPDGDLGDYLDSLERLREWGDATALTAHGPILPSVAEAASRYLDHRQERLAQVRQLLAARGAMPSLDDELVGDVAGQIYPDVPVGVRAAAEASLRAQLAYLMA